MFGRSELFSLFNDTFAWSGLLSEGLVIILFVVADIYRSKSPLAFCICIFQQEFFYIHRISKTSRKDLYFCRLLALILFIKIDEVKSASLGSNMRFSGLKILKEGLTGNKGWTNHWRDPEPRQEYDILIIGGGGHGLSTAYYLAKKNKDTPNKPPYYNLLKGYIFKNTSTHPLQLRLTKKFAQLTLSSVKSTKDLEKHLKSGNKLEIIYTLI